MVCFWSVWNERGIGGIHKNHSRNSDSLFWSRSPSKTGLFFSRLYCTERALWKLHWFLRDFGYDADLLNRDQVDEKALLNLRGVVRTSHKTFNGRSYQNLDFFGPAGDWEVLSCASVDDVDAQDRWGDSDGL